MEDVAPRRGIFRKIEHLRANPNRHWFAQCVAEAIGVFLFTYTGGCVTLAFALGTYQGAPGSGSLFGIGVAFAIGLALAILICAGTSGGHFGWNVTVSLMVFAGFPIPKGIAYMIAQWFGGFCGYGFLYQQYSSVIKLIEADMIAKGIYDDLMFTPNGVAGVFALYPDPKSALGNVFLTEFVGCFAIGLCIWACLDPTNFMASPPVRALAIPAAYAVTIAGFLPLTFAANAGRDLGGRMVAIAVWGTRATGPGDYCAIAALTNIPATLLAVLVYECFLADSARPLNPEHERYLAAFAARDQRTRENLLGLPRTAPAPASPSTPVNKTYALEKQRTTTTNASDNNVAAGPARGVDEHFGIGLSRRSVDAIRHNGSEGTLRTPQIAYAA